MCSVNKQENDKHILLYRNYVLQSLNEAYKFEYIWIWNSATPEINCKWIFHTDHNALECSKCPVKEL